MIQGSKEKILSELSQCLPAASLARRIGIKINLQSPPEPTIPRTDVSFLFDVITLLVHRGHSVTILEGANGHLQDNLKHIGLQDMLALTGVSVIDIDLEQNVTFYERNNRVYSLPDVLREFDIRIAIPCATKRPGYLFSCNVKTFVGLLPRCYCNSKQKELSNFSRPIVHEDLTCTVTDIFSLFATHMPFFYYLNGGNIFSEYSSLRQLQEYYFSNDAVALDFKILECLNVPPPSYLMRLKTLQGCMRNESF
jgi:uncharacterized protein (DUF362 family)